MDKQINIVEILAEQCKNCTLYEGDTVSLNISIFDRQLKGVCFNNNIYFSVDELNYIMQKLISKEQECKNLREDIKDIARLLDLDTGEEYNFGNIESAIKNYCYDCDVAERMRKVTYAATGGRLSYANYTVEAIEQAYNDQLRIDVEYRTKELEEQLDQLKSELEQEKAWHKTSDEISKANSEYTAKLKQTLTEIKEIIRDQGHIDILEEQILQKISECEVVDET